MNVAMDYKDDFERGYDAGFEACQKEAEKKALKLAAKRRRKLYFLKQKLIGVAVLLFTVLAVILMDGDATLALITVPLSLALIFSRKMLWGDKYYYETARRRAYVNRKTVG